MLGLKFLFFLAAFVYSHTHGPGCSHDHEEVYAHAHDNHNHNHDSHEHLRPTKVNPQHHESQGGHEGHNHGHADSFVGQLWDLVKETCPWVMLGLVLTGLLQAFPFSTNLIKKHLQPGNSGLLSCMKAALVGLLTPLCSCGALPLAIALLDSGCSLRAVIAFLTASQSAGIDSMLITYGLLGPYAMVARLLGAAVLATATGFATPDIQSKSKHGSNSTTSACCDDDHCEEDKIKNLPVWSRVIHTILSTFEEVVPWVFLGVIVTAICSIYFPATPPDYQKMLSTNNTLSESLISTTISRALILIFTLPLQMCEHACVTFAVALQKIGASQGTAFAFLLSAPATNVATLMFLFQRGRATNAWMGGVWAVVRMTGSLVAAGVALSFVFDLLDLKLLRGEKRQANWFWNGDLPAWWEPLSLYMAGGLILLIAVKKLMSSKAHVHKD